MPIASTIVNASTNSTADARNTETTRPIWLELTAPQDRRSRRSTARLARPTALLQQRSACGAPRRALDRGHVPRPVPLSRAVSATASSSRADALPASTQAIRKASPPAR